MFLIPFRVKNAISRFPIVTITIIVINIVVYIFTTNGLLSIKENVALNYSFCGERLPFFNYFTSIFLHADPSHIIGNMLFLFVFGPAVEDRLGIPRYIAIYFVSGLAGALLQAGVDQMIIGTTVIGIGASGCILGVMGAYWRLFPWSTVCVAYWVFLFYYGVFEVAAIWVIGVYVALDLMSGILSLGAVGGVAHFVHFGGAVTAVLMCMAMGIKRDTAEVSEARGFRSDAKDLSQMPMYLLQTMLEQDPTNPELIRGLINQAIHLRYPEAINQAMARAGHTIVDSDPSLVAYYLTTLNGRVDSYHPVVLMRLAGGMERLGSPQQAIDIYRLVYKTYPNTPDAETVLYRMAHCYWNTLHDAANARDCIREMMSRFPNGVMSSYARTLWTQIERESK